ncbi:adaptor protein MecA [Bombilactobacillus thymidiniphilus]|uniref:Adaptor protein MecA n=1 Tax=Bombilactobacillus thymidiniphilus TaxID=2923363 RepID=A0ABY4PCI5_9LACO|nr:adaptor protein MecA [Bombilactobacillus thymidiniphilus]UQS83274.1 adaptor protein MecA [Bombilactobacillus thymidiniphilus]
MEVEHVNENMIRVILERNDLQERGVEVLDLLENRKQIESFFYNILEEVDTDHSFVKDQTVTFQVVPNNQGLELLITKVPLDEQNNFDDSSVVQATEALAEQSEDNDSDGEETIEKTSNKFRKTVIFSFIDFENFVDLSKVLRIDGASVITNLYQYRHNYYLELSLDPEELRETSWADLIALMKEYGFLESIAPATIAEFGTLVMKQTALELTRYYFN